MTQRMQRVFLSEGDEIGVNGYTIELARDVVVWAKTDIDDNATHINESLERRSK